jgi:hypothetical protein
MEPPEGYHMFNPIKDPEVFGDAWESGFNFGTTMSASAVRSLLEGNPRAQTNFYQYWRTWGMIAAIGLKEVQKDAKSEEGRA